MPPRPKVNPAFGCTAVDTCKRVMGPSMSRISFKNELACGTDLRVPVHGVGVWVRLVAPAGCGVDVSHHRTVAGW